VIEGPRRCIESRLRPRARALGAAALVVAAGTLSLSAGAALKSAADQASKPASSAQAKTGSASAGTPWSALKPAQQSALAPLQNDWPALDAERKAKWLELAARMPSLPADEQQRIQTRMTEWARLTPAERGRARLQFQQARELGGDHRQAQWDAYQALPADQRRALAEQSKPAASGAKPARPDGRPAVGIAAAASASTSTPTAASNQKRNFVVSGGASGAQATPVSPTSVQASPGATTTLISKPAEPPAHHQPGLPKIAATGGFVDPATLLPRRGPQGAVVQNELPASSAAPDALVKP
jgi:hypothetical protein